MKGLLRKLQHAPCCSHRLSCLQPKMIGIQISDQKTPTQWLYTTGFRVNQIKISLTSPWTVKVQVASSRSIAMMPSTFLACMMLLPCVPMARPISSSCTENSSLCGAPRELCFVLCNCDIWRVWWPHRHERVFTKAEIQWGMHSRSWNEAKGRKDMQKLKTSQASSPPAFLLPPLFFASATFSVAGSSDACHPVWMPASGPVHYLSVKSPQQKKIPLNNGVVLFLRACHMNNKTWC